MTSSVKQRIFLLPRRVALLCGLLILLLMAGYGGHEYRQYRYYLALQQQADPVIDTLHHLHHRVMTELESGLLLDEQVRFLSLRLSRFARFLEQQQGPPAATSEVLAELNRYLENLRALQDADIHSRYALQTFIDSLRTPATMANRAALERLVQLSRLYLNAPSLLFVYELEQEAERLLRGGNTELQASHQQHQLYLDSLKALIGLRRHMAADDISALLARRAAWQQQGEDSWERLLLLLASALLLIFSLGLLLLYARNRQLQEGSRASYALAQAKTDFLANMSHEIRTPMNAIIGFSSLLQQTPLDDQQSEYLKKIKSSSDNLLLLINDILDLTKVEAGKLELEDIEFDLNEQLERLSALFADMSEQKQLEVIISKAPEVPDRVRGDPLRLGQVLVNLVSNAVKFTERGEVVLSARVVHEPDPRLCFEVRDTGIGIMPEQLDKLFLSFTQVDASTTRKYGGSGLGLSISHHLVQLMQGSIRVASLPGRGSTFTVTLPLRAAERLDDSATEPVFVPGQKVLLVDDNALVIEMMSQLLRRAGFVVYAAQDLDGAKALIQKRGSELRLALIDCCLGQDNGLDVARYLVQQPHLQDIGIVIISAFGRERPSAQMRALGIDHYLSKPVTQSSLLGCLSRVLHAPSGPHLRPAAVGQPDTEFYRGRLAGRQILLAEDNRVNQQLIVEFLKKVDVAVTLADNGRQAVEQMARRTFDAILMDLQMPILDGVEATRQIRKLRVNHDIPIIALTASAMRGDRETSLGAGMNAYVTKPVHRFDLYQALVQAIGSGGMADPAGDACADHAAAPAGPLPVPEPVAAQRHQGQRYFAEQHQDDIWLLQAALAGPDWQDALATVRALAEGAEACRAEAPATLARELEQRLLHKQLPDPEQIRALAQAIADIRERSAR